MHICSLTNWSGSECVLCLSVCLTLSSSTNDDGSCTLKALKIKDPLHCMVTMTMTSFAHISFGWCWVFIQRKSRSMTQKQIKNIRNIFFFHRKSILWIQSQSRFRHINIGVVGSRALVQLFNDLIKIQTNMSRSATIPTHQQNNKHTVFNVHSGWEMSLDWNALLMMMRTERIKINNHRLSSFLVVV